MKELKALKDGECEVAEGGFDVSPWLVQTEKKNLISHPNFGLPQS